METTSLPQTPGVFQRNALVWCKMTLDMPLKQLVLQSPLMPGLAFSFWFSNSSSFEVVVLQRITGIAGTSWYTEVTNRVGDGFA
jgi:hypothetical protein